VKDVKELGWFREYFDVKANAFGLIFGIGKAEARKQLINWGYMVGEEYVNYINAYDQKYSNYRDYVDLSKHWEICDELLGIINSGRAVDVQGALNVVDTKRHRAKMEQYAREEAQAAVEAASAAKDTAAAARDINSTLRDINSKL
jgi:hypothetical protein